MRWKELGSVLKEAALDWYNGKTFELGAALAYYGVFAIAPMLVITVAVADMVLGADAAEGRLVEQLRHTVSPLVAESIADTLGYVHLTHSSWLATLVGAGVLLFGVAGVFTQLQSALDTIWEVKPRPGLGIWASVRLRLMPFLLVGAVGALGLASLAATTALSAVSGYLPAGDLPGGFSLLEILSWVLSLGLLTLMFALVYKLLPDVEVAWRVVWIGAITTAVLFTLGNYVIGLYLGRTSAASAYGAAGSLVVVLLWVYYSSQIMLFGAQLTQAYAKHFGEPFRPAANAVPLGPAERACQGLGG
jgi:membrane protein